MKESITKMEQIIIATHIVKPSSPTPAASKIHKLSSMDQIAAPFYIPLIFFYQNDQSKQQTEIFSQRLRESLSEILTIFHPLAGTIRENSFVDCNDRGAMLVEARVHGRRLEQLIQQPEMEELRRLIPVDNLLPHDNDGFLVSVKASYFECGGVAVGVCFSHKIMDMASFVTFMNAWAATSRREEEEEEVSRIIHPFFDLAIHFPPRDLSSWTPPALILEEKTMTKRIVFEREKLAKLKQKTSTDGVKDPSTVEALSVFIWRSFIEHQKAKPGTTTTSSSSPFVAVHAVNMRPRTVPPFPDHTFGNFSMVAAAVVSKEEDESGDDGVLASKLRAALRAVDGADCIHNFIKGGVDKTPWDPHSFICLFTSWWRFPMYDVDFGWGKPVWVCPATVPVNNLTIFLSTPSGDGIEAWVNTNDEGFLQSLQANCNTLLLN